MFGFLMGMGAGAAVGMLFAPQAGHKTRGQIAKQATDSVSAVKTHASGLWDSANSELRRQRKGLKDALKAGTKAYQRA